jgi:hypothetical protein
MAARKYDDIISNEIIEYIKTGLPRRDVAALVGIHVSTLCDWINRFPEFGEQVMQADAISVQKAIKICNNLLENQGKDSAKMAQFWLQAKRPREFGKNSTIAIENADNQPFKTVNIDTEHLSTAQIAQLLRLAASIKSEDKPE